MPISHPLKAIFVHIPKTGGTSVEAALGMHGDKSDIGLTPYFNQTIDRQHLYGRDLQHLTASQIKSVLNDDAAFARYYKFTIVRNPWERLVSTLAWSNQKWARGEPLLRGEFARSVRVMHAAFSAAGGTESPLMVSVHLRPQMAYIVDGEMRPQVDFVARHETLEQDWEQVCARLGISLGLPRRMRSHHLPYVEYYDDETRDMVAEMYARDVSYFGYRFSQASAVPMPVRGSGGVDA